MREDWIECTFEDLLDYLQPTKYIVESTKYNDDYKIPVLTAGKSFIKGYTNETGGVFDELPAIIFDDFTTASQYVDFEFKVKSSAMKILVPTSKLVNMKFAFNCMQANKERNDTHKRYWISVYAKKKVQLPSLAEQIAIVSKTEELFSDLDNGIANLKKAQEQLKIYRQAVLKKAFEGELTKEWREKQTNLPTVEELLVKIKKERQNHYNEKIEDWKKAVKEWHKKGKDGKKPNKPVKILDFNVEDFSSLNELPLLWSKLTLAQLKIFSIYGPRFSSKDYVKDGIAVLRTSDINNAGKVDWLNAPKLPISDFDYQKYKLIKNDLLITRTGSIGRISIFNDNKKAIPGAFLIHYRLLSSINIWYVFYFFKSTLAQLHLIRNSSGIGRPNLNVPNIEKLYVPLCSLQEQNQIVQEIETRLSVCDKVEQSISESLEKAEALRQSILKKAFEGKLLSEAEIKQCKKEQDYEPASELLKKIKAEKEASLRQAQYKKKKELKKKNTKKKNKK